MLSLYVILTADFFSENGIDAFTKAKDLLYPKLKDSEHRGHEEPGPSKNRELFEKAFYQIMLLKVVNGFVFCQ